MRDKIETIDYRGFKINIYPDVDAFGPDHWGDDNLFLVNYHRDFYIEHDQVTEEVLGLLNEKEIYDESLQERVKQVKREYWIFPLSMLSHSGVTLSLGQSFASDGQGWDTSHVGAVFAAKSEFKTLIKAGNMAEGLVSEWNTYLSGAVYGYQIEDKDGEEFGGVWSFYGYDHKESGLLESAQAEIDTEIRERAKLPKAKNFTNKTLGEFLSSEDETIRRNAGSILKQLQRK